MIDIFERAWDRIPEPRQHLIKAAAAVGAATAYSAVEVARVRLPEGDPRRQQSLSTLIGTTAMTVIAQNEIRLYRETRGQAPEDTL